MRTVAIVGVGQSVHAPARPDVDKAELVLEAVDAALADAGVGLGDLDNAVTASLDFWDGRTISNMAVAEVVGSYLKPESRLCSDGLTALIYGWARIADGEDRLALITSHCKESEGNLHVIENAAFDPFSERRLDADGDVVAGLTARSFYETSEYGPLDAAEIVVAARRAAQSNPEVAPLAEVTAAEVREAPLLASPLTVLDKAPVSDGSCAVVLAAADVAGELGSTPVWVSGVATATGRYWSDRDPTDVSALEAAVRRAAAMAGWADEPADLVELSAQYSYQALQFGRVFGIDGGAGPALNPSGGWLAGNPLVVTGLSRATEAARQIRGAAGARQVAGVRRAYAHGVAGLGAQTHSVVALESDR